MTVFLGANPGKNPIYRTKAAALGRWLASKEITLVYGGGRFGLMGVLAESVIKNGGQVDGVITRELYNRHTGETGLHHQTIVSTIEERKHKMIAAGDAVLTFPGGIGTLEEFSTAASAINLGNDSKPVAIYNVNHYYDPLKNALKSMVDAGFYGQEYFKALDFDDDLDRIYRFMENYQAPKLRMYR